MAKMLRITTVDNPFDPFDEFASWFNYDTIKGYHTCERIDTVAYTSENLSDAENYEAMLYAFSILSKTGAINKEGNIVEYKKVEREAF